jgi:hypothetical protein
MRKLILGVPLLAAGLAGCVTAPSLAERMSQFVGQPESVLVQQLGVPNRTATINGTTYLAYIRRHTEFTPGSYGYGPFMGPYGYSPFMGPYWGGWGGWGGFPPQAVTYSCETTFIVVNKLVRSFTLRGNDCT